MRQVRVNVTGAGNAQPAQLAEKIYHAVLSRPPTRAELFAIESHASETYARPQELAEDLVWALINEPEFVYIH